jgi:hypothetical protein
MKFPSSTIWLPGGIIFKERQKGYFILFLYLPILKTTNWFFTILRKATNKGFVFNCQYAS